MSTGATKESEAKRFLKLREGAVATGAPIPPRLDRIRYDELRADLVLHYQVTGRRSLEEVEDRLVHLDRYFAGRRATAITPTDVVGYIARRQAQKTTLGSLTSNRTINIELALLRRMFRLGVKHGKVLRVPSIEMLKEAAPRAGFFEDHQFRAVRRLLPPDLEVAALIGFTYGWRRSEVLGLARHHVDLKVGTVRLDPGTTKNREGRVVYLTPELKALLMQQIERVETLQRATGRVIPHLFPHLRGRLRGRARRGFGKKWRTVCRKAGAPGRLFHDLRRTAVRNMERAGVPRSVAMKITGHRTESIYRRYAIVSDADLQDATRRLTGTPTGTPAPAVLDPNLACQGVAQPGSAPALGSRGPPIPGCPKFR